MFFVVGLAKSGTSWLMNMLDAHPDVLCKGEGRFFGRDSRQERLKVVQVNMQPTSLYNAMLSSEDLRLWIERSPWSHEDDTDEHLTNLTGLATEYFLKKKLMQTSKKIVGDKTPLLTPEFVEEISSICPEAKIIHIIRDGRDSAVSMMHHIWNRSTDQGGIQQLEPEEVEKRRMYREDHQRWLETSEGMFTENRLRRVARNWKLRINKTAEDGTSLFGASYTEVHYEDLLHQPHEEVRKLAEFLGADTGEEAIEQAVSSASFEKSTKGRQRGQEDASSFFRKGIAGDWKNYFTERDKHIFKEEAGDLLIRLGYEEDYDW